MKELQFLLSLKNNLSAPLGKARQSLDQFADRSMRAFKRVGAGAVALWGVGESAKNLLAPAHEMRRALDELSTRNVSTQAMDKLYKSAQQFSTAYGKSAVDFVASVTIIKSQLANITDAELPRYTQAVNVLAVATKGTAEQAAGYMSYLANQFAADAKRMGNVPFAEMMASKTAYMVQNFGADMAKIQGMLTGSKGMGSRYGVGMDEQLAVMGELSRSLGTEAGGVYEKFMANAVEGGKSLGLSFTDAQGKLLTFPDILQKLQGKFGATIAGNVKAQALLNKAFGEGAQALAAAWGNADALRKHMRNMGNTAGLDRATEMARKMADMWERVSKVWERIRIAVGMQLIPAIAPLIEFATNAGIRFAKWLEMFPNVARWIGYITLAVLGLGAAAAVLTAIAGLFSLIFSPVTLTVLAVVAALAALAWAVYDQYQYWRWAFTEIGKDLQALWAVVVSTWESVAGFFSGVWDTLTQGWDAVVNYFATRSPLEVFSDYVGAISGVFSGLWDYLTASFGKTFNWIASKLNQIPGIEIDLKPVGDLAATSPSTQPATALPVPAGMNPPRMAKGGISRTISTSSSRVTDNSRNINEVNIYPQNGESFNALMESRELAAP